MAEFSEVMRQFDRMCKANAGCINCPLHQRAGCADECSIGAFVHNTADIERKVMSWAAEHPEPVYPTWYDWMAGLGLDPDDPIPADIAEKLGIEPTK